MDVIDEDRYELCVYILGLFPIHKPTVRFLFILVLLDKQSDFNDF